MPPFIITLLIAVGAVGLFVLALSITRIRKGHDLESDVGSNREMRRRGIECTQAEIRREEAARRKSRGLPPLADAGDCNACGAPGCAPGDETPCAR